jgi:hypothetical protein
MIRVCLPVKTGKALKKKLPSVQRDLKSAKKGFCCIFRHVFGVLSRQTCLRSYCFCGFWPAAGS